jgi:hypothetical protein
LLNLVTQIAVARYNALFLQLLKKYFYTMDKEIQQVAGLIPDNFYTDITWVVVRMGIQAMHVFMQATCLLYPSVRLVIHSAGMCLQATDITGL